MKEKLTTMERRAKAFTEDAMHYGSIDFTMFWNKSNTWELCPSIKHHGNKIAHASGCGYDKESACLAEALRFLCPSSLGCGGCGVSTVQDKCKQDGWNLECTYRGKFEHGYRIEKIKKEETK